jgi:hypothetical protein
MGYLKFRLEVMAAVELSPCRSTTAPGTFFLITKRGQFCLASNFLP